MDIRVVERWKKNQLQITNLDLRVNEPYSMKRGINASAKNIDSGLLGCVGTTFWNKTAFLQ